MEPIKSTARPARFNANLHNIVTAILMIAIFVMVNYLGARYYYRRDFSQSRYYDFSEKTHNVLKNLDAPVNIITCMLDAQARGEIEDLVKQYQAVGGDKVKVERVDQALDLGRAEALARAYNFREKENVVILEYKGRSKVLYEDELVAYSPLPRGTGPMVEDIAEFRGEQQITAALESLMEAKPSKVYFLQGHGERELSNLAGLGAMGQVEARVARENITTATLDLVQSAGVIPEDCDALVIAGPKYPLSPPEIQAIAGYLKKKGKVILLQDPGATSGLEGTIEKYGLRLDNDLVLLRLPGGQMEILAMAGMYGDHPVTRSFARIELNLQAARSITILPGPDGAPNPKTQMLIQSVPQDYGETTLNQPPVFDPATDKEGPLVLAAVYDDGQIPGEKVAVIGTRLIVVGSASFLSNAGIANGLGVDFFLNSLNWILKRNYAIGISPKRPQEYPLGVSPLKSRTIILFSLTLLPLAGLAAGFFVWYSRRK